MTEPSPTAAFLAALDTRPLNREVATLARQYAKRHELFDMHATTVLVGGLAGVIGFLATLICVATIYSALASHEGPSDYVSPVMISLAAAAVLAGRVIRQLRRAWFVHLASDWSARGVCWTCRYSLRGLPRRPDASIACPECGCVHARWQISLTPERELPTKAGARAMQSPERRASGDGAE